MPEALRQRLHTLVQIGMGNQIETRADERGRDVLIRCEIIGDRLRECGPIGGGNRTPWPPVVPRVDPPIPKRERDVQLRELGCDSGRKCGLETIESAANLVKLPCAM